MPINIMDNYAAELASAAEEARAAWRAADRPHHYRSPRSDVAAAERAERTACEIKENAREWRALIDQGCPDPIDDQHGAVRWVNRMCPATHPSWPSEYIDGATEARHACRVIAAACESAVAAARRDALRAALAEGEAAAAALQGAVAAGQNALAEAEATAAAALERARRLALE